MGIAGKDCTKSGKLNEAVNELFARQLENWEQAARNYEALNRVKTKTFTVSGHTSLVQFNPARIVSSAAKVDKNTILNRACFLCKENRPQKQEGLPFSDKYTILINPFPIFPRHLTIPTNVHTPQRIKGRIADMLDLARELDEYVIFYNGPRCGASAPDHMHFQAGNKGFLPIETEWNKNKKMIRQTADSTLWSLDEGLRSAWMIESGNITSTSGLFDSIYQALEEKQPDEEPMMNLLVWYEEEKWYLCIFSRKKHRPDCFFAEGDKQFTISPATVDLGGVFITPLEKDFERITPEIITEILHEI